MKRFLLSLLFLPAMFAVADGTPDFSVLFEDVVESRLDVGFFQDAPYNPADYPNTPTNALVRDAITAMSNHVDSAIAMIPSVVTNNLRRNVFLLMAGHAGTNAFLRVWDAILCIAETNSAIVSPNQVNLFSSGATTPLEGYVVFHYDDPSVQALLGRTRNLFPTNTAMRIWYDETISGTTKVESLLYATESGNGLPFGAR